jgi:hypothetical protein
MADVFNVVLLIFTLPMPNTFCTIITADYYPRALALYKSIQSFNDGMQFHVLIADNKPILASYSITEKLRVIPVGHLLNYSFVNALHKKYTHHNMDVLRWSLKPVLLSYLLENGFDRVIYLDCDMFFVNDYAFLFEDLNSSSVLLTPHWKNSNPLADKESFYSLFANGIFSAGFIGASKKGLHALQWWAEACHFSMGYHPEIGIHDDQKYLDIFPVKFETVKIIRHKGCNIGAWNYDECERRSVNGQVLINGEFPVIFIHFDGMLIRGILRGHDKLLLPYFEQYQKAFEESGAYLPDFIKEVKSHSNAGIVKRAKWKLNLRYRIKRMLYKLAERI